MSLSSDIMRGHTETVILAQLLHGDGYGYQINKALRERSGGVFEAKEATLYTAFRRLEESGLIRSYWGDEQSGARRRYYALTEEGRKQFYANKQEWQQVKQTIDCLISD